MDSRIITLNLNVVDLNTNAKGAMETLSWYVVITTKPPNMIELSYNTLTQRQISHYKIDTHKTLSRLFSVLFNLLARMKNTRVKLKQSEL